MNNKYLGEMEFWMNRYEKEKTLGNGHYKDLMLPISGKSYSYFSGKSVADFGCGPRGSLEWCDCASKRVGIDVLVDEYKALGIEEHKMKYVKCSERGIPIDDAQYDVCFSVNSLDHADNPTLMFEEMLRITKDRGLLCLSLNLDEPPSITEPNMITQDFVREVILSRLNIQHYIVSPRPPKGQSVYGYLQNWAKTGELPPPYNGTWGVAWVSGSKL
jgi:ubiquinone/menaquinone biosynthesis C-methylase UbiE